MRRRIAALTLFAAWGIGCVSGQRPVKQLDDFDYMIGGSLTGPGIEADPEVTGWFRFAPIHWVDITLGATVTMPIFESASYGGLAELRTHVPIGDRLRLVLAGGGELFRFRLTERTSVTVHRLTFAPTIVYQSTSVRPYVGPKLEYLSHMQLDGDAFDPSPGIRANGDGIFFLGAVIGLEDDVDALVLGGSVGGGLLMNGRDVNAVDGVSMTASVYIGY